LRSSQKARPESQVVFLKVLQPPQEKVPPKAQELSPVANPLPQKTTIITAATDLREKATPAKEPASMVAPPAPTADEWAFAAKYTGKNSKGYRYSWGQQVRSMMGTAVEGPDQGFVRFRIEIAPDGTLAKLETIWTTSAVAEQLARKAVESCNPYPPHQRVSRSSLRRRYRSPRLLQMGRQATRTIACQIRLHSVTRFLGMANLLN
jgi:hypothetical protein